MVALLLAGLLGLLVLNTVLAQDAFRLHALQVEGRALADREQALQRQVSDLQSPHALAARATSLGMVPGGSPTFLRLSDGKVLGRSEPACRRRAPLRAAAARSPPQAKAKPAPKPAAARRRRLDRGAPRQGSPAVTPVPPRGPRPSPPTPPRAAGPHRTGRPPTPARSRDASYAPQATPARVPRLAARHLTSRPPAARRTRPLGRPGTRLRGGFALIMVVLALLAGALSGCRGSARGYAQDASTQRMRTNAVIAPRGRDHRSQRRSACAVG